MPQYWAAQLAGGITASLVHRALFGDVVYLGATALLGLASQSFGLEIVLTLLLMVVITSVATDTRAVGQAAAIAIGGTIGLEALFAGPISGASMNPARSLAPAIVSGTWQDQWLYVAGPAMALLSVSCSTTGSGVGIWPSPERKNDDEHVFRVHFHRSGQCCRSRHARSS